LSGSSGSWKEPEDDPISDVPESCASCNLAEKFESKAGSIVASCKKNDCKRFNKPVPYKYIVDLEPSPKISVEILEFVRVAERIARERQRQPRRMKHDEEERMDAVTRTTQITRSPSGNAHGFPDELQTQFDKLDNELKQINDSFDSKFEGIRKRLARAKELRAKEQAEPKSEGQTTIRAWNQLIEKYRKMLKAAESELDTSYKRVSGINGIVEARMKQVEEELPVKEYELKVEQDLKENTGNIEELQKQVGSLRKQQEECVPRKEKLKNLLDRIQYCTGEK